MTEKEWLGEENQLGLDILHKKYMQKGETFDQWLDRVSGNNQKIRQLIVEKKFLFGGRTLSNRGLNNGSNSNCYSRGYVEDSLDDIMLANTQIAKTFKAQGGQGISLSHIRPQGAPIGKKFISDGILPFMEIFNSTTASISQGNSRRGALMMSCDVWHKDILDFIKIKTDNNKINNANLSVEIDDEFMTYIQDYYLYGTNKTVTIKRNYSGHEVVYTVEPVKIFKFICECAKKHAEPGVLFVDSLRNYNMMEFIDEYQIETTNPCGEQPLPKHGCCNLGSINLDSYVINAFETDAYVDLNSLQSDIRVIVRAMDDLIDENQNNHALIEQKEASLKWRNVGIGVMGIADMLAKTNYIYGSDASIEFLANLMKFIFVTALEESVELGKEKGSFPGYKPEVWDSTFIKRNLLPKKIKEYKEINTLRNSTLLSIAPTGSISTMLNISGGIEPWFATSFTRRTVSLNGKDTFYEVNIKTLQEWYDKFGDSIAVPDYFITAKDINSNQRVKLQGKIQQYIDTAISSTINLPKYTTTEDIEKIYLNAWSVGCKGVTVYVDGSRDAILSTDSTSKDSNRKAPKRPKTLEADWYQVIAKGTIYNVYIGLYEGKPYEIFAQPSIEKTSITNGHGTITKVQKEVYAWKNNKPEGIQSVSNIAIIDEESPERVATLLASLGLRHGADIKYIIKTLKKVNPFISSFTAAMIRVLNKYNTDNNITEETCPECNQPIVNEGGCQHCTNCGWSRCMILKTKIKKK